MSAAPLTRWVTAEQFAADPRLDDCYLLNGEVIRDMGTAHSIHENIKARLHELVLLRLRDLKIPSTVLSDSSHQFDDYTVMAPDVSVHLPPRQAVKGRYF